MTIKIARGNVALNPHFIEYFWREQSRRRTPLTESNNP
jgi:hypothetical protein